MLSRSIIAISLVLSLNAVANENTLVENYDVNKFANATETNPVMDLQVDYHNKESRLVKPMIIGGWDANPDTYNFHARVVKSYGAGYFYDSCGGSIINDSFILTAAHCVFDTDTMEYTVTADEVGVVVKNFSYDDVYSEEVKAVKEIHIYLTYGRDGIFVDDIAVLELASPIIDNVSSMPLATMADKAEYDFVTSGKIIGLGYINDNMQTPDFLQENNVEILSQSDCEALSFNDNDEVICIQSNDMGVDNKGQVCEGDSGGTLGYTKANGDFQQIGVTSYGYFSCEADMYGVFAETAYYEGWIRSIATYGNELEFDPEADNNDYHSFGDNNFDYGDYIADLDKGCEGCNADNDSGSNDGGSGGSTGLISLLFLGLLVLRRRK
ncbi:S1 family peptidase [Vibrio harveyi]|uniref:S1 family peptidase n=1 Tax=Vibrio harveyi TaxID=669 RepID=UPI0023802B3C|nr:serine protease [Vibrio harveyi]